MSYGSGSQETHPSSASPLSARRHRLQSRRQEACKEKVAKYIYVLATKEQQVFCVQVLGGRGTLKGEELSLSWKATLYSRKNVYAC